MPKRPLFSPNTFHFMPYFTVKYSRNFLTISSPNIFAIWAGKKGGYKFGGEIMDVTTPLRRNVSSSGFGFLTLSLIAANTMNGPGLLALSSVFYRAGWVPAVATLFVAAVFTGYCVSLFAKVLQREDKVEFADLSERYLGETGRKATVGMLAMSLTLLAAAQIVVTAQAMDAVIVGAFGSSTAVTFYPSVSIITTTTDSLMPFPQGTYGISLGFVLDALLCTFLGRFDLQDNVHPQYISAALIGAALVVLVLHFVNRRAGVGIPAFGESYGELLGVAVFNFAFVIAVPSLFSDASSKKTFGDAMWNAVGAMFCVCVAVGATGAMYVGGPPSDNVLQTVYTDPTSPFLARLAAQCYCVGIALPIPVYHILCKRNIGMGAAGEILSVAMPWSLAFICYMQPWFAPLLNWSSLLCLGWINYTVPLLITYRAAPEYGEAVRMCLLFSTVAILAAILQNVLLAL